MRKPPKEVIVAGSELLVFIPEGTNSEICEVVGKYCFRTDRWELIGDPGFETAFMWSALDRLELREAAVEALEELQSLVKTA